jgi:hypothetical protein
MTSKADFTPQEWEKVASLPGYVLGAAAWSDGKAMPAMREVMAGGQVMMTAAAGEPDGSLVKDLFSHPARPEKPDAAAASGRSAAEMGLEMVTVEIQESWALLRARATPEELAKVRSTLEAAAKAAVERLGTGFWGSGDEKVSSGEQAFLERLDGILADLG